MSREPENPVHVSKIQLGQDMELLWCFFIIFPPWIMTSIINTFMLGVVIHTFHPNSWVQKQADLPIRDQPGLNSEFQGN